VIYAMDQHFIIRQRKPVTIVLMDVFLVKIHPIALHAITHII